MNACPPQCVHHWGAVTCPHLCFLCSFFPKYRWKVPLLERSMYFMLGGLDTVYPHVFWSSRKAEKKAQELIHHVSALSMITGPMCENCIRWWPHFNLQGRWTPSEAQKGNPGESSMDFFRPESGEAFWFQSSVHMGGKVDTLDHMSTKYFCRQNFLSKNIWKKYLQFKSQTINL